MQLSPLWRAMPLANMYYFAAHHGPRLIGSMKGMFVVKDLGTEAVTKISRNLILQTL